MKNNDFNKSKMPIFIEDLKHDVLFLINRKLKKFESLTKEELCEKLNISLASYDKKFMDPKILLGETHLLKPYLNDVINLKSL